ncbi:hypothetical protein GCM10009117_17330 [Gangjinia marincola]|uniref:NadR/Ttd14 AAA domain-containing protein n=1 Tax=Gangjinia marincola TaxID=578463 RepID=A0ABP3XX68_9FLAO
MDKIPEQLSYQGIKIVLFGPESTGKTTLARSLLSTLDAQYVSEFARNYLQKKWNEEQEICTYTDLIPIIRGQITSENIAIQKKTTLVICDTNPLQYQVYCRYYFKKDLPEPAYSMLEHQHYDLYLLTGIDVPWEKDDLRDRPNPKDRAELYATFEQELLQRNLPFVTVHGNKTQRLKQAMNAIKTLERLAL